jgi:hypothetical protein
MSKLSDKCKEQAKEIRRLKEDLRIMSTMYKIVLESDAALRRENSRLQELELEKYPEKHI